MNAGRMIAIGAMVIGFALAAIASFFFATQVQSGALNTEGLLVGAFIAFVVIASIVIFGIYLYVQSEADGEPESQMAKQRRLLDWLHDQGTLSLQQIYLELDIDKDDLTEMLDELVGLGAYSGYLNWEDETLHSVSASELRNLHQCKQCNNFISVQGKGVICQTCGTHYMLP